ncbi:MAG: SirB2 family protein [Gammaproteobacteria bacterium]|nr:SirB2 family protein [Gammaproteobacteria bacterium]
MAEYYLQIRLAHVILVCCSGALFAARGLLAIAGAAVANHAALRWLSYTIDTCLLTAALMLVTILQQYPFVQPWLTAKVLLLAVYIVLGVYALRRARTRQARIAAYVAALLVYLFIASVAWRHDPRGIFAAYGGRQPAPVARSA